MLARILCVILTLNSIAHADIALLTLNSVVRSDIEHYGYDNPVWRPPNVDPGDAVTLHVTLRNATLTPLHGVFGPDSFVSLDLYVDDVYEFHSHDAPYPGTAFGEFILDHGTVVSADVNWSSGPPATTWDTLNPYPNEFGENGWYLSGQHEVTVVGSSISVLVEDLPSVASNWTASSVAAVPEPSVFLFGCCVISGLVLRRKLCRLSLRKPTS